MQIKLKLGTWNQFNRYVICKWDSQIQFRHERKSYVNHRFLPVFSHIALHNMMADTHRCSRVNHKNIWNWEIHVLFKILLFMLIFCSFYYNLWKMSFLFTDYDLGMFPLWVSNEHEMRDHTKRSEGLGTTCSFAASGLF